MSIHLIISALVFVCFCVAMAIAATYWDLKELRRLRRENAETLRKFMEDKKP